MAVRIGCGMSNAPDPRVAAIEAGQQARSGLAGRHADLAFAFCSGGHLAAPEATLEGVHEALEPPVLAGCGAGGVVACGHEQEHGTAVAVWAAALDEAEAQAFHLEAIEGSEAMAITGLPDPAGASCLVLLPDPYGFPTDVALEEIGRLAPGVPVVGGLSSARTLDGEPALFIGDRVAGEGAVGVRFTGVEVVPCVSQGAAPIGPELTVTEADGHVIQSLAGRPALQALRSAIGGLSEAERALVTHGLLLGIVVESGDRHGSAGNFLVRGLLGADPDSGTIAVGAAVEPGTVVRLHARDAASADEDLRSSLGLGRAALGGEAPAGALLFTCNGRGEAMFGAPDHDAGVLERELHGAPAAGFFAAGEIGPVGGRCFLNGFTATVAVFAR